MTEYYGLVDVPRLETCCVLSTCLWFACSLCCSTGPVIASLLNDCATMCLVLGVCSAGA